MGSKKWIGPAVETGIGLLLSLGIMAWQGAFAPQQTAADRLLAVCNGFSVTALLYICFGILMLIATTGLFDIFSFAIRKGMHTLLPVIGGDDTGNYYEYKMKKQEKRRPARYGGLIVGLVFLAVSIVLTAAWYSVSGS